MSALFCISVHFLQPYCHARGDGEAPEWPPSPLRVFQALVSAAAARWNERESLVFAAPALRWLETQPPPDIYCVSGGAADAPYRLYVRDNIGDLDGAAWSRGAVAQTALKKTEKDVRSVSLDGAAAVHYVYSIDEALEGIARHVDVIRLAARSMTHLGSGIDMVAADADIIGPEAIAGLPGDCWRVAPAGLDTLRCPRAGSLDQMLSRHQAFLGRLQRGADGEETFHTVPPLTVFRSFAYRRATDPVARPFIVFRLVEENEDSYRHPLSKTVQVAGMVRHLAIEAMKKDPPAGPGDRAEWVERYVAGHRSAADTADRPHPRLSYLPLPSIGHPHADLGIRRAMIAAPFGDDAVLEHVSRRLDSRRLVPEHDDDLRGRVFLKRVRSDKAANLYTLPSGEWASVTPVILPGHDDHKPAKTCRLIEKALRQSGIDQPCDFEWSPFSQFPKSLSAHKYDRDKRPTGFVRPSHLLDLTAVHLRLEFKQPVPGPLAVGAGRHCGLGIFAGLSHDR